MTERPLRADARRNYEQILAAARAAFAELGPEVPLDVIARRAGVGNATLYRRFPSREPLIEAVYRDDIARLTDQALELARSLPPDRALEGWIRDILVPAQQQPGLAAAVSGALARAPEVFSESKQRFTAAAEQLVAAAKADGAIRSDAVTNDILRMASGIAMTSTDAPEAGHRMITIMMDGLRANPPRHTRPQAGPSA